MSEFLDPSVLGSGISSAAAFEGLRLIAVTAYRRRRETAWARGLVDEVTEGNPDLLRAKEARRLAKWIAQTGVQELLQEGGKARARATLVNLKNGVLASDPANKTAGTTAVDSRAAAVFRAVIRAIAQELGPETVHVLTGGVHEEGHALEQLVADDDLAPAVRAAISRELATSRAVLASGLLLRPFLHLEGDPSPTTLLRPVYGVVPFDDSAGRLNEVVDWAQGPDRRSVLALLGPAGAGKTRLAIELCRVMSREGWRTGSFSRASSFDSTALAAVFRWNARRILVVDYAEDRPDFVRDLLTRLHGSGSRTHPVRLVLTVRRDFGSGWRSVFRGSDGDDLLDSARDLSVLDGWHEIDRERFFAAAQSAFRPRIRRPAPVIGPPPSWVHDETFSTPLALAAAALTNLLDGAAIEPFHAGAKDVFDGLLTHEANYWRTTPGPEHGADGNIVTERVLIAAALGDPAPANGEAVITDRLMYCTDLHAAPHATRRRWARWVLKHYPSGRLEPDLLLEHLVSRKCQESHIDDPIDWPSSLLPSRSAVDLAETLTLLARVAHRDPGFATTIAPVWRSAFAPLVALTTPNQEVSTRLLSALTAAATELPIDHGFEDAADSIPGTQRFARLGAVVLRRLLDAQQAEGVGDERHFRALLNLGVYLGLLEEHVASASATVAAAEWAKVARTDDPDLLADLAQSLANLAGDLVITGKDDAAKDAGGEAVSLYRVIVHQVPGEAEGLAAALLNLGGTLTMTHDDDGALSTTEEAVEVMRTFDSSDENRVTLALGLINLALCLIRCHRDPAALGAAREALDVLNTLAPQYRLEHDEELLKAHSTLSSALTRVGHHEESLASQREAVAAARRLYGMDPARWRAGLSRCLSVLALRLDRCGRNSETSDVRREAEDLFDSA